MANIEITAPLLLSSLTALASLLVATGLISRRAHAWDDVEKIKKHVIDGDPENDRPSLLARVKKLEEERAADAQQMKYLKTALSAHGSDEHVIVNAVRKFVGELAHNQAAAAASEVRRALAEDQNARFDRADHTSPHTRAYLHEDDPFPTAKILQQHNRIHTPYKPPLSRDDPDSSDPPPPPPPPPDRRRR